MAEQEFQTRIKDITRLVTQQFEETDRDPEDLDARFALLADIYDRLSNSPLQAALIDLLDRATEREANAVKLTERLSDLESYAETLQQNPQALVGVLSLKETDFARAIGSPAAFSRAIQRIAAQPIRPSAPPAPTPAPAPRRRTLTAPWTDRNGPLTLGLGSTGPEVAAVQCFLYHDGFGFPSLDDIDGLFDPEMEVAVLEFQQENDLEPDGVVGPETQQALVQSVLEGGDRPILSQGSPDPAVVSLQTALLQGGYLQETRDIDGQFGPRTAAAVIALQQASNLTPDGIVGPDTWQALTEIAQEQPQAHSRNLSQRETPVSTPETETARARGQQVVAVAAAEGTAVNGLWTALTGAVNNAIERSGEPELRFLLPSGTPIAIAGDRETNTISVTDGQGELIASQQVQDGQLSSDIRDPGLAEAVRDRLEAAQKEAEQVDPEPQPEVTAL